MNAREALGDVAERTAGRRGDDRHRAPPLAPARARFVERAQVPGLAHQREHPPRGLGAMAEPVLAARRRARRRSGRTTAGRAAGRSRSRRRRAAPRAISPFQRPIATSGSGSSAWRTRDERADEVRARGRVAAQALEQQRVVGRVLAAPKRLAILAVARARSARSAPRRRPARRRARRRTGPSRRRSPRRPRRAAAWRALASAFSTKVACGSSASSMPSAPWRDELDAERREQRGELGELAGVVGGEDQPHAAAGSGSAERAPLRRDQLADALVGERRAARPSRRARRPRLRPCPAARRSRRAPVMTTFMSVSQAESSTYSRSSSGVPSTMPTETAATKSRIGERTSLPCASSQATASCAATKAPVIAAVRVPPSACSTSQSSEIVRSPSGREVEHAAQRAADQALDLLRAPALLAARRLAVAARVRGARQHAVLGRQPALAAAALVRRHLLLDRGGAQHLRVAERRRAPSLRHGA